MKKDLFILNKTSLPQPITQSSSEIHELCLSEWKFGSVKSALKRWFLKIFEALLGRFVALLLLVLFWPNLVMIGLTLACYYRIRPVIANKTRLFGSVEYKCREFETRRLGVSNPFGKFLIKYHLHELPILFDVLEGKVPGRTAFRRMIGIGGTKDDRS